MRHMSLVTAALAGLLWVGSVHAAQVALVVGQPTQDGDLVLGLADKDGNGCGVSVHINKTDTPDQKAQKIKAAVDGGGWLATLLPGPLLIFQHNGQDVPNINYLHDTTGESTWFGTLAANVGSLFAFGLDGSQPATGVDDDGNPSFVFVYTPAGSATVCIQPGDCAEDLITALSDQLQSAGVLVTQTSSTRVAILDPTPDGSYMAFQITDVAIPLFAAVVTTPGPVIVWGTPKPGVSLDPNVVMVTLTDGSVYTGLTVFVPIGTAAKRKITYADGSTLVQIDITWTDGTFISYENGKAYYVKVGTTEWIEINGVWYKFVNGDYQGMMAPPSDIIDKYPLPFSCGG